MNAEEALSPWRMLFEISDIMRGIGVSYSDETLITLTFNQLRMIKNVHALNHGHSEGVSLKDLAKSLGITPAAASEMVDVLVHKNVLSRELNPDDRRAIAIRLADGCRQRFEEMEHNFDSLTEEFLATLPADHREVFVNALARFREFMLPYKK